MKKLLTTAPILSFAVFSLWLQGCKKVETPPAAPAKGAAASAEKTSFRDVTAQLEPGGSLYVYLSTEQLLVGLGNKISGLRQAVSSIPNMPSDQRENVEKVFGIVTGLVKDSGVEDISGFGASSIAREPGLYHTKVLLHHYPGRGSGFLWTMFGQKPHAMEALNLLPDTTVMAYLGDVDVPLLWSVIRKQVGQADFPAAEQVLAKLPEAFENATGLKWDRVLASLGGECGVVFMLDEAHPISLPLPGAALDIPEPSLMVIAKVKDDTIFTRLETLMKQSGQNVEEVDEPDLKMRTLPLALPLPIQLRPAIARSGDYLLIANSDNVIKQALAVKAGQGKGLKSTAEYQRLSKDLPQQGNQFSFASRRFSETIMRVQQQAMANVSGGSGDAGAQFLQSMFGTNMAGCSCAVSANTDQGWLAVGNGNQHPAKLMLAASAVPIGMLSAIAIPNFVKARQTAQKNACINNLRQIEGAKQMWGLENKKTDTDTPSESDLIKYLANKQFPTCPASGSYTINALSEAPECSNPEHRLPR